MLVDSAAKLDSPAPASDEAHLTRPIVYGSIAIPIKKPDSDHTHKWTAYVRGTQGEDISHYIKKVIFRLHDSFPNPSRAVEKHPFELTETGWGEFQLNIKIVFQDQNQKPLNLSHHLKLYPSDESTDQTKALRPVVSEHYDQIIFCPPTKIMSKKLALEADQPPSDISAKQLESAEISKIDAVVAIVSEQISELEKIILAQKENADHSIKSPDSQGVKSTKTKR